MTGSIHGIKTLLIAWQISICLLGYTANAKSEEMTKACVIVNAETNLQFSALLDELQTSVGFSLVFAFPPYAAMGYFPNIPEQRLNLAPDLQIITSPSLGMNAGLSRLSASEHKKLASAWSAFCNNQEGKAGRDFIKQSQVIRGSLSNDIVISKSDSRMEIHDKLTSEFLIGKIALGILLMESNGSYENWTNGDVLHPDRPQEVWMQIIQGLDWICEQSRNKDINVSFWFDNGGYYESVSTDDEPILTPSEDDGNWIIDAMNQLGYGSGNKEDRLYSYLHNLRSGFATNWAATIFVVDSWNDPDGRFPGEDLKFAYTDNWYQREEIGGVPTYVLMHGGPYLVMTYDNYDWGIGNMKDVLCHELCHVFGAPGEYNWEETCRESSFWPWEPDCHSDYGYLFIPNYNCINCNPNQEPCIMAGYYLYNGGICQWTAQHIGWRDSDGDGPVDPIDPNKGGWQSIYPINLGDLIKIFTLTGDFVNLISVTSDNSFLVGTRHTIWNGLNFNGQVCAPDLYLISINGGTPYTTYLHPHDLGDPPIFSNIGYSNGKLSWTLTNSYANVRCFIYNESQDLVARPIWDKFYAANYPQTLSLGLLEPGHNYTVRFYGWRPDGAASATVNYPFFLSCVGKCGDANADNVVNVSDAIYIINYVFTGESSPKPVLACGDANTDQAVNVSDGVWVINFVFAGGNPPGNCSPGTWPPGDGDCCPYTP